MKNILYIHLFFLFSVSIIGGKANAATKIEETNINCRLPGCSINCILGKRNKISFGNVDSITMTIYENGITKLLLKKHMEGNSTVVVGPDGYICSIGNQKK